MRVNKKMSHNQSHIHMCNAQQCKAVQCKANQSIDHDLDDDSDSADDDDDDVDDHGDGKVGRNDKQCKALGGLQSNTMQCKAMQSNVQQRRALLTQHKAMQSKAMQDSVSRGKRKAPNWGRAGFI